MSNWVNLNNIISFKKIKNILFLNKNMLRKHFIRIDMNKLHSSVAKSIAW